MAYEPSPDISPRKTAGTQQLLLAGVAAAGLMGLGLGLWARPAMSERRSVAEAPPVLVRSAPQRQIQIIVDDTPAPIGEPIQVLPDHPGEAVLDRAPERDQAPTAPARGLMRVEAPAPATIAPPKPKAVKVALERKPAPKAERPATLKVHDVRPSKADRHKDEVKLAKASPKSRRHAPEAEVAEARPQHSRVIRVLAHLMAHRTEPKLEKVKYEPHAKARPGKAAKLTHPAKSQKALADRAHVEKARVEKAGRKPRPETRREAVAPPSRPSGLMKVSNSRGRCGQSDPGAALVCADPSLGAADRQMGRAYREARAAGVSDDRLERQQQRWLSARSAAAREAPWAVHDVYLARIAELNGMARDAQGGN